MNLSKTHVVISAFLFIGIVLATACRSTQLTEANLRQCLARTDFEGMNAEERNRIAWLIDYERKVRETKCCAIEPRVSLLMKPNNILALKTEVMSRIDTLEAAGDSGARANLRQNDSCHAALNDLYFEIIYADRRPK